MSTVEEAIGEAAAVPPYAREAADVVAASEPDVDLGLSSAQAAATVGRFGANEITAEPPTLLTSSLTGHEWLACFALAAILSVVVETGKWLRRRRAPAATVFDAERALAPARALRTPGEAEGTTRPASS